MSHHLVAALKKWRTLLFGETEKRMENLQLMAMRLFFIVIFDLFLKEL